MCLGPGVGDTRTTGTHERGDDGSSQYQTKQAAVYLQHKQVTEVFELAREVNIPRVREAEQTFGRSIEVSIVVIRRRVQCRVLQLLNRLTAVQDHLDPSRELFFRLWSL